MRTGLRNSLAVTFLAGVALAGAWAGSAKAGGTSVDAGRDLIWRLPMEQKLEKSISFSFDSMPLRDVLDFFRQSLQLNIILDQAAVAEDEKLITFTANDLRAREALDWVMTLSGLEYAFRGGALYVSTPVKARAAETQYFEIYDVRDLTNSATSTTNNDDTSNDSSSDSSTNNNSNSRSSAWLVAIIIELTGRENWRSAVVVGGAQNNDDSSGAGDF